MKGKFRLYKFLQIFVINFNLQILQKKFQQLLIIPKLIYTNFKKHFFHKKRFCTIFTIILQ